MLSLLWFFLFFWFTNSQNLTIEWFSSWYIAWDSSYYDNDTMGFFPFFSVSYSSSARMKYLWTNYSPVWFESNYWTITISSIDSLDSLDWNNLFTPKFSIDTWSILFSWLQFLTNFDYEVDLPQYRIWNLVWDDYWTLNNSYSYQNWSVFSHYWKSIDNVNWDLSIPNYNYWTSNYNKTISFWLTANDYAWDWYFYVDSERNVYLQRNNNDSLNLSIYKNWSWLYYNSDILNFTSYDFDNIQLVYDNVDLKVYFNNELVFDLTDVLTLNNNVYSYKFYFKNQIYYDDIMIWNRVLSPTELVEVNYYNANINLDKMDSNFWPLYFWIDFDYLSPFLVWHWDDYYSRRNYDMTTIWLFTDHIPNLTDQSSLVSITDTNVAYRFFGVWDLYKDNSNSYIDLVPWVNSRSIDFWWYYKFDRSTVTSNFIFNSDRYSYTAYYPRTNDTIFYGWWNSFNVVASIGWTNMMNWNQLYFWNTQDINRWNQIANPDTSQFDIRSNHWVLLIRPNNFWWKKGYNDNYTLALSKDPTNYKRVLFTIYNCRTSSPTLILDDVACPVLRKGYLKIDWNENIMPFEDASSIVKIEDFWYSDSNICDWCDSKFLPFLLTTADEEWSMIKDIELSSDLNSITMNIYLADFYEGYWYNTNAYDELVVELYSTVDWLSISDYLSDWFLTGYYVDPAVTNPLPFDFLVDWFSAITKTWLDITYWSWIDFNWTWFKFFDCPYYAWWLFSLNLANIIWLDVLKWLPVIDYDLLKPISCMIWAYIKGRNDMRENNFSSAFEVKWMTWKFFDINEDLIEWWATNENLLIIFLNIIIWSYLLYLIYKILK